MITSKKLLKQKKINHGFFNNRGGISDGIYRSLNCGLGSRDKKNKVRKNLEIVKDKIGKKSKNIYLTHQVHSNKLVFIDKKFKFDIKKIKADAIITDQKKVPIGILTADCVPILLYDNKRNMIAAIHAGWKGAFKGIIKNVISKICISSDRYFAVLRITTKLKPDIIIKIIDIVVLENLLKKLNN